MPVMQPPVLQQPMMQPPAMRQPMTMMQQPTHAFTFKFTPAAAADVRDYIKEANWTDVQIEEANAERAEADALAASDPSPKNCTAMLNSNQGMKQGELPVVEKAPPLLDDQSLHDCMGMLTAMLNSNDRTKEGGLPVADNSSSHDCKAVVLEPQLEIPEFLDPVEKCNGVRGTEFEEMSLDMVHNSLHDDCMGVIGESQLEVSGDAPGAIAIEPQLEVLELVDADAQCNSVVGANGDYRSGMARQAAAYMLKNSTTSKKVNPKMVTPWSDCMHSADNSTAASCTASIMTSRAASVCPSHRSATQEEPRQSTCGVPPSSVASEKPRDECQGNDDWAFDHSEAPKDHAQSVEVTRSAGAGSEAATTNVDTHSYVSSIICPPVMPASALPTSGNHQDCALETIPTESTSLGHHEDCTPIVETIPTESTSCDACHEIETKGACEQAASCESTCNSEDVCPQGHDLRWHAWNCAICDKRGYGLRFGCVECREANLCLGCRKNHEIQKEADIAKASCEAQPAHGMNPIAESKVALVPEAAPKKDNSNRKERPVDSASKSVLSMQPQGSSSAAQLLGGLALQQGSKPRSSSRTLAGEAKSVVGAAESTQRRTCPRASASVLSVKHTSCSAAAGVLGPLLEQRTKS